ncbi:MAG: hypothetical protein LUI02_05135 [Clostridiales bacterium]|nr:hypothetical protein [Clostridiales bacterium]
MSQAKVERYKQEKANRKKIIRREKRQHVAGVTVAWVIIAAIVVWACYSGYSLYASNIPTKTIYTNISSMEDYFSSLSDSED